MTTFVVEIAEQDKLDGVSYARASKNASLPLEEGQALEDHPDYLVDDAAYIQFVVDNAAQSYASQAQVAGITSAVKAAVDAGTSLTDMQAAIAVSIKRKQ